MKLIRYAYPPSQGTSAFNQLFDLSAPTTERFGSILNDFLGSEAGLKQHAVDLYEDNHNYYARFELPGVSKDEVDLEHENAVLTISSEEVSKEDPKLPRTRFKRSISVPDDVDLEKISATMEDGLLTVTMPKAAASKPRQINIQ